MLRFIFQRLLQTIPVVFIVVSLTFFMVRLAPGGPFSSEKKIPEQILKKLDEHYGLNLPTSRQYLRYWKHTLQGDLGPSTKYEGRSVKELIAASFPVSLELGGYALAIALLVGFSAGFISSFRPNTFSDYAPMSLAMVGICVPTFVMGPLLLLIFALGLNWFNVSGWDSARDKVLPSLTLGLYYAAYVARLTRGGFREILSQDFIRTARAKGASPGRVLLRHALRGAVLPVTSFLGPAAAGIITGSFVVELIFQVPGLGRYFIQSAFNRDYSLVCGTVLLYATLIVFFNLAVDVLQAWLNPRIRLA